MPLTLKLDDATIAEIAREAARLVAAPQLASPSRWMTPDEVADYLRCDKRRVYDLRSSGRLEGFKENGRLLFKRAHVEALFERAA
ncbi:MAG: helix-turn-helix domain-containing protein [Actinomycetota bacterium]